MGVLEPVAAALSPATEPLTETLEPVAATVAPVATWDCGYAVPDAPRLQYSASSFAQFAARLLLWAVRERKASPAPLELFPGPRTFTLAPNETLLYGVLLPASRRLAERCARLRVLQHGSVQLYLLYVLVALVLLLAWAASQPGERG